MKYSFLEAKITERGIKESGYIRCHRCYPEIF